MVFTEAEKETTIRFSYREPNVKEVNISISEIDGVEKIVELFQGFLTATNLYRGKEKLRFLDLDDEKQELAKYHQAGANDLMYFINEKIEDLKELAANTPKEEEMDDKIAFVKALIADYGGFSKEDFVV